MIIALAVLLIIVSTVAIILKIKNYSLKKKIWSILEKTGSGIEATKDDRVSTNMGYAIGKMTDSIRQANKIFEEIKKIATLSDKKK